MHSPEEQLLLAVGIGYLVGAGIAAVRLLRDAEALLRTVRDSVDPELWQELGAPANVKAALDDPERRWITFLRSERFRARFPARAVDAVDAYRRRTNWVLIGLVVTGLMILYRFWPYLKPDYL